MARAMSGSDVLLVVCLLSACLPSLFSFLFHLFLCHFLLSAGCPSLCVPLARTSVSLSPCLLVAITEFLETVSEFQQNR